MPHLKLDQSLVDEARALALHIVEPVIDYIGKHTTGAIERTTLRLIGIDGIDEDGIPLPNRILTVRCHYCLVVFCAHLWQRCSSTISLPRQLLKQLVATNFHCANHKQKGMHSLPSTLKPRV